MKTKIIILFLLLQFIFSACTKKIINGEYIADDYYHYHLIIDQDSFSDTMHHSLGDFYGEGTFKVNDQNIITFQYHGLDTINSELIIRNYYEGNSDDSIRFCITCFDKETKVVMPYAHVKIINSDGQIVFSESMNDTINKNCFWIQKSNETFTFEAYFFGYKDLNDTVVFNKNMDLEIFFSEKEFILKTENGVVKEYKIIKANNKKLILKPTEKNSSNIKFKKVK